MTVTLRCPGCGAPYAPPRSLVVRHSDECPYAPTRSRHGCDPVDAVERRRRAERAAWLDFLSEEAALRVTSGYRFAEVESEGCERCGGEGRVLDRDFPHGPRWMPCPWCAVSRRLTPWWARLIAWASRRTTR